MKMPSAMRAFFIKKQGHFFVKKERPRRLAQPLCTTSEHGCRAEGVQFCAAAVFEVPT
jgi:hypothetical protein